MADPDLQNKFTAISGTSVPAGQSFDMNNKTDNVADPSTCQTLTAASSETKFVIEYKEDNFSQYDTVQLANRAINSIIGGGFFEKDYSFLFSQPGQYRITSVADGMSQVFERDETNNAYSDAATGTNKRAEPLNDVTVTVTPNPDFDPIKAGFAPGEYVKIFELN